jgi:UDP-N-acetylmuramoylalanine--D-glutamate ligase
VYLKNQTFLVAGLSRSGIASAKFLTEKGAKVFIFDDLINEYVDSAIKELVPLGCINLNKDEIDVRIQEIDILVLSPGVPIDNFLPVMFRKLKKRIIGEMELGAYFLNSPVIAVTGTNGKTTTVSIISEILKQADLPNELCGNIGIALTSCIEKLKNGSIAVIEVSSFQLETLFSLKPHIAIITNITPDHLNRHYNMENYTYLKSKILQPLRESEYAILNYDDETVKKLGENTRGKIIYFSLKEKVEGCYVNNGNIFYFDNAIINIDDINIKGLHNIANCMVAIIASKIMGVSDKTIKNSLMNFKGVKHRIELVREINGTRYYNDSKGTNVDASLKAIESMDRPTIILLGGRDKGYDYDPLFNRITGSNIIHAVIYGENRFKLIESAKKSDFKEITVCNDLVCAIKFAKMLAKRGENILLSPASSSFDEFSNYEERGKVFVNTVEGFEDESQIFES